jgi:N-acetylglucosamine-6-phosphate deacetylase
VLTLDRALFNFIRFTGASIEQALCLLSSNPAAMTGLAHRAGTLAPGKSANMTAIDSTGKLVASIIGGHPAN